MGFFFLNEPLLEPLRKMKLQFPHQTTVQFDDALETKILFQR